METSTLGITINTNSYQVLRFQAVQNWQPIPQKRVFYQQHFPDNAIVSLENTSKKKDAPQIIINASGDMTAFKLTLGSSKQAHIANIIGKHDGTVTLQLLNSP